MVNRPQLQAWLDSALDAQSFKDYCPNGLQVEGKVRIGRLVSAVSASRAVIEAAVDRGADAVLVHHGLFWRNDSPCVVGMLKARLAPALKSGLNIFAYHLPLDAHPQWGNNVQLGRVLGFDALALVPPAPVSPGSLVWSARLKKGLSLSSLSRRVERRLGRTAITVKVPAGGEVQIDRIAWCTGGAQGYLAEAAAAGAQLYISGEISEQTTHEARELGVSYIAAGHHATERFGVQALGAAIAAKFGVTHEFLDENNPA